MVRVIPRAWWPVSEPYGDFDFNRGTNKNSMRWFTPPYRDHRKEEPVISAVGGCVMRGIGASGVGTNHSHAGKASPALWEATQKKQEAPPGIDTQHPRVSRTTWKGLQKSFHSHWVGGGRVWERLVWTIIVAPLSSVLARPEEWSFKNK